MEKLASEPDGFAPATLRLADLAERDRDRPRAHVLLDQLLQRNAKDPDALAAKAKLQLADGKLDDALSAVRGRLRPIQDVRTRTSCTAKSCQIATNSTEPFRHIRKLCD